MQSLPYNDIEQIATYLHAMFSGNNPEVQTATEIFQRMSSNITQFLDSLMLIIMNDRSDRINIILKRSINIVEEFLKLKNAACTVLASCLSKMLRNDSQSLENKNYMTNAVINAMFSNNVFLPLKMTLKLVLQTMYNADTSRIFHLL